jgi:hypothetical protein
VSALGDWAEAVAEYLATGCHGSVASLANLLVLLALSLTPILLLPRPCSIVVGSLLGWAINEIVGTPGHLRYHVIAACGFGNVNR